MGGEMGGWEGEGVGVAEWEDGRISSGIGS